MKLPRLLCRLTLLSLPAWGLPLLPAAPETVAGTWSRQPLAPRSQTEGSTLFTTLDSAAVGLISENHYADPAMWGRLYREFTLGAIGTGLAAGDFDGDGRVDLFVASKTEQSRLFRNLGSWRFEDVTVQAGVNFPADAWTQGVAFADVNNDGWLDLYVCRFNAPNLLFINQGNGRFVEEGAARGLAVVDGSSMAAFADFDRDGWLDVYLQTNALELEARPNGQPDHLFRNRGDGTFENVTAAAGVSGPTQGHSATWWDYDADGWPDLYVANDFKDPDVLYRNNRDGTFSNVLSWVVPHTPHSSMGADLADVNNDGHIDLLVADMAATTREKDHRGMARLRAGLHEPPAENPRAAQQYMQNSLFLATGTGRVLEAAFLAGLEATDWTWSVRLEDLDNDGWVDAHFTNGMVRELHQADILERMMAHENLAQRSRVMRATPRLDEENLVYRNSGDLRFENASAAWGLNHRGVSFGAVWADFDGDGDLDLVCSNYEAGLTVCRNDAPAGHRLLVDLRGTRSNRFGVGARVEITTGTGRQVRQLVLARGYLSTSEPVLHFGLGGQAVVQELTVHWPSGYVQRVQNLAADHRYRLTEPPEAPQLEPPAPPAPRFAEATALFSTSKHVPPRPYDELRRQPLLPVRRNMAGPAVAVADLDRDGREDVVLTGTGTEPGEILSNLGDGQYLVYGGTHFQPPGGAPDGMPLLFDANGDGAPDLLLTTAGVTRPPGDPVYQPRLLLNDGNGKFAPAPDGSLPALFPSVGAVAAADFDRDGDLDLFLGARGQPGSHPSPADSHLLLNEGGRFRDVAAERAPDLRQVGVVNAAVWTDLDGDGWLDLVVAREWNTLLYLRNEDGKRFTDASAEAGLTAPGAGLWQSVLAADFNEDGQMDLAVGNLGENTRYRASPERPARLFRGPLGGREQILEAVYSEDGDALYPVAAREQLVRIAPALARRFPTDEAYARATLEEVVGPTWIEEAQAYAVQELRSGVFLSEVDGRRTFHPLPRLAQLAPLHGVAATDVNGDGHVDLLFVGNSYAPPAWVGRFDGGLGGVLLGDGRGRFSLLGPTESGWAIAGDAQALVTGDWNSDGWPDALVTRHHDRRLALVNQGAGPRAIHRSFAVQLRGPRGNPTGMGARVTVEQGDGRQVTAELAAGAGYLSQSSPTLFFGYPEHQPPRSIRVRWPDGRTSQHPWHATPLLQLDAPTP